MKLHIIVGLLAACLVSQAADGQWLQAYGAAAASEGSHNADASAQWMSIWIWSDRYVYLPAQTLTLRWTAKSNADPTPYTVFIYRQDNQTGRKYYFPGRTELVTDYAGMTAAQGYNVVTAGSVNKGVLIGNGGLYPQTTAPEELGMHTYVFEARDASGTRVLKSAYMKISVVTQVATVSGAITSDTTWTNTKSYLISGVVTVKNGATLTIEPGTVVQGASGSTPPSVLLITRNGKIRAAGTRSRPIIMTSAQPFGQRKRGDWGGLLVLGKAPINVAANTQGGVCPAGGCQNAQGTFYIEGLVANDDGLYGGTDPNHNCGTMQYIRMEYSGSILSQANETNSFTWAGCGKDTVADHLQAIYGLDDSFEWFGGTMDAKYLVGGLGADDYADFQLGYTGRIQYGIFYQSSDSRGNRGIEGDNSEYDQSALPFSNPTLYNLTFIGSGQPGFDEGNAPGIFLRRGSRGSFNNIVVTNFYSAAVELNDANTRAQMDAGNLTMNGILMWKNSIGTGGANTLQGQIVEPNTLAFAQGLRGQGRNFVVTDPQMRNPFELDDPDWTPMAGSPIFKAGWVAPPDDGFFDQSANFIGGMGDVDWTEEWTNFLVEGDITP